MLDSNNREIVANPEIYVYPQETWNAAVCKKLCKHIHKDGLGTKYSFPGYVGHLIGSSVNYNGGTVINDKWYRGVRFPLPSIPDEYEFRYRPTWGWTIQRRVL